jgi:sialidase-1
VPRQLACIGMIVMLANSSTLADPAQPAAKGIETLLTIEPTPEYPRNSEGDIVELKDGRLCLVYTRFSGGTSDHATADLVARFSADGGKTWTADRVLVKNEGRMNVMSVSILRLKSGDLLLFYLRKNDMHDLQLYVRRSSDEFETLSEPVQVTVRDGYNVVNNDRVIQLSSGRLVAPAALHPPIEGTKKAHSPHADPCVYLSDDEGRTWRADQSVVGGAERPKVIYQEPGVVELKDGRLFMYIRTDAGSQYQCFSEDGGEHWTTPRPGPLASPLSPATIGRIPWTGDLVCVWNDHSGWHAFPEKKRTPLCLAISKDEGRTWSPSRVIEGDPRGWYCYTSMTFVGDRLILSYCAGDEKVGGLNRLKVVAISREWLLK